MVNELEDWVKRLGQWHFSQRGASETLCGQAMLGNNYARVLSVEEREPCVECHRIAKERSYLEYEDKRELVRSFSSPLEMDGNMWVVDQFLEGLRDMGYEVKKREH
jgi:hypothetical protein